MLLLFGSVNERVPCWARGFRGNGEAGKKGGTFTTFDEATKSDREI